MIYELIIIGAGPAGITSSIYAARKKMNLLVLSKDIGGQTSWSGSIENYTGYQIVTGPELTEKFRDHIKTYDIKVTEGEDVLSVKKEERLISIKTNKTQYKALAVIIASGKTPKQLDVPGEQEYKNKGIAYCATCDGPLFAKKRVAIIGGGNSALDAAIQLSKIASKVYIINITPALTADAVMREIVENNKDIEIYNSSKVKSVKGDRFVNGIEIEVKGTIRNIPLEGVFVEIGLLPNSDFIESVEKNKAGEIKVNCACETNIPGIFAAGDVTSVPEKQIIVAAGEGAKATLSAFRYVVKNGLNYKTG
jgi:NADH-dependent peroxiredoxin subunit F